MIFLVIVLLKFYDDIMWWFIELGGLKYRNLLILFGGREILGFVKCFYKCIIYIVFNNCIEFIVVVEYNN